MIWSLVSPCRTIPLQIFPTKFAPQSKTFFWKEVAHLFRWEGEGDTMKGKHDLKQKEIVETQIYVKDNFLAIYCYNCTFLEGGFFQAA